MSDKDRRSSSESGKGVSASSSAMNGGRKRQSAGIMITLLGVLLATVLVCLSEEYLIKENLIMIVVMFITLTLAAFGLRTLAIVFTGIQIFSFLAYKIYSMLALGNEASIPSFILAFAPAIALTGVMIFASGLEKMKIDNQVLLRQVDELAIIDPLTGLYNLRGLYMDIQTQISYAERNGNAISLMILQLRYPVEMKAVLKTEQYNEVIKRLSRLLVDSLRLEDKVYTIGPDGKFAIVLTCNKDGTKIVEKRLRDKIEAVEWLTGIANKPIRADIKLGYMEYSKTKFNRDVNSFIASVEEEVEYDM